MGNINLNLGCSLEAMREMEDNQYDLAIVDPPYGINRSGHRGDKNYGWKRFEDKGWDKNIPSPEYFEQLFRVSKNQIIWGANYFAQFLTGSKGWIVWDKAQHGLTMSDGELAYSSFDRALRIWSRNRAVLASEGGTIHPTQKPVALYRWLLDNYAQEGDKILDTHLGSGSIALACYDAGFSLDAWEIDPDYHGRAVTRFEKHSRQLRLFGGDDG
jgi:site-specific DNA-methyltransferase (adenine-specific)